MLRKVKVKPFQSWYSPTCLDQTDSYTQISMYLPFPGKHWICRLNSTLNIYLLNWKLGFENLFNSTDFWECVQFLGLWRRTFQWRQKYGTCCQNTPIGWPTTRLQLTFWYALQFSAFPGFQIIFMVKNQDQKLKHWGLSVVFIFCIITNIATDCVNKSLPENRWWFFIIITIITTNCVNKSPPLHWWRWTFKEKEY